MISRSAILTLTSAAVFGGTLYSLIFHTYFDTSDPLLAHLLHPLHTKTIFAQKSNVFNVVFVKWAWAWTSVVFLSVWMTSPNEQKTKERWFKWAATTFVWGSFVSWFFGPGLFDRLWVASGGECMIRLPDGHEPAVLKIASEFCISRSVISPQTHPALFTSLIDSTNILPSFKTSAKLYRGHDVSGHIFLLTLSLLFLHDQLRPAWRTIMSGRYNNSLPYKVAVAFSTMLMSLWLFMILTTSIYWHSPFEKLSGYAAGLAGFTLTQLPCIVQSINSPQLQKQD